MRKRLLALLLTFASILALLIFPVGAANVVASGECGENVRWSLTYDGQLTITGTGPMTNYGEEDYPWLDSDPAVTSIVIGEGVTTVGDYAFAGCVDLKSVTLPESLRYIGGGSFVYCTKLQSIAIPAGVEDVEVGAFVQCESLEQVNLPDAITCVSANAFRLCSSLTSIAIPEGVTYVDTGAFAQCGALKEVSLPKSLKSVEQDAFSECANLTDVYYAGSEAAWNAVEVFDGNEPLQNAALHCAAVDLAITAQPEDAAVTGSNSADFRVQAVGENLTYQWQYKNPATGVWKNCSSATQGYNTDTLTVVGVSGTTNRNGYQYRCKVSDGEKTLTTSAATLTVKESIVITGQPADATAKGTAKVSFRVQATGEDLTYQWQYKKPGGAWKNCSSATVGYNTDTLTVAGVSGTTNRNDYQYRCKVTGGGKTVTSDAATLTVFAIRVKPVDATVTGSEKATFQVQATGADLTYQWQYKKPGGAWKNCSSATQGYNTDTLTVVGASGGVNRNGYQYRCKVTSGGQTITSSAATLTVH